jgi:hypothetical protein
MKAKLQRSRLQESVQGQVHSLGNYCADTFTTNRLLIVNLRNSRSRSTRSSSTPHPPFLYCFTSVSCRFSSCSCTVRGQPCLYYRPAADHRSSAALASCQSSLDIFQPALTVPCLVQALHSPTGFASFCKNLYNIQDGARGIL